MKARYLRVLQVGVLALFAVATAAAQSRFTLAVHTGRGANGYDVNSTMISGEKDMLLIDPQFSVSKSRNAAEMRENVLKRYPGLGMEFTLNDRINTYFPAPAQAK